MSENNEKRKKKNYLNNEDLLIEIEKSRKQGQMTDKLALMLQTLCYRYSKKANFAGYCVDRYTECFIANKGWVTYDKIEVGDKILSYDYQTKSTKLSSIVDLYVNENYNGPIFYLTGSYYNAVVTPNHKIPTLNKGLIPVENVTNVDEILLSSGIPYQPTVKVNVSSFNELNYTNVFGLDEKQLKSLIESKKGKSYQSTTWYHGENQTEKDMLILIGVLLGYHVQYDDKTFDIRFVNKQTCKGKALDFHGGRSGIPHVPNRPTYTLEEDVVWCPTTEHGTFYARRKGFVYITGNSYVEDMQAYAMMSLVKTWKSFDPKKSQNPFAFFTQCVKNSFIQYLNAEKKQRNIRDELMVDQGLTPSYTYQIEHSSMSLHLYDDKDEHERYDEHFEHVFSAENSTTEDITIDTKEESEPEE